MADMNLFDFSRMNSIDDAAQKFVDISKGINGTVQITATQITKFQEAVEKLYTETEKKRYFLKILPNLSQYLHTQKQNLPQKK